MKFNILIVLSLLLIVLSCKKDQDTPQEEYVSGKFGSDSFYFKFPFSDNYGNPDTMSNVAHSFGFISIHRNDAKFPAKGIAMFFVGTWIDSIPLNLPIANSELQLLNFNCRADTSFGPNDSCNYVGGSYDHSVDIRITDKKDDILTGTFSGIIRTRTGLSKQVTDGKFRIRLIRKQE